MRYSINSSHHAIHYIFRTHLYYYFFFNKIWVLLNNYSHNVIIIYFTSLFIPLTQSKTVCQFNFPHVGQEPWIVSRIPVEAYDWERQTESSFPGVDIASFGMISMGWSNCTVREGITNLSMVPCSFDMRWSHIVSSTLVRDIFQWYMYVSHCHS